MDFIIKNHKMLFWRLGNMNSVKQKHFGNSEHHQPPTSRGIWCFPYPYHDLFFAYHQWEAKLPKKFRRTIGEDRDYSVFEKMTDDEATKYHEEREQALKKVKKLYRPTTFWYDGKFYSHYNLHGCEDYDRWFLWDSVSHWANEAKKHLFTFDRFGDEIVKLEYSKDCMEIFIPNYK